MTRSQRRLTAVVAIAIVAFQLAYLGWMLTRGTSPPNPPPPYSGDSVHRERIDQFVAALRQETTEDALARLTREEGYDYPGVLSLEKFPQDHLERVLSNRRVLKLWAELKGMPREQACAVCERAFAAGFETQQATIERVLRQYEDPDAPKNQQSMMGNQWGVLAAVFLSAQFCGPGPVRKQLGEIDSFSRRLDPRLETQKGSYPDVLPVVIKKYLDPDNAFRLNVLVQAVQSATPAGSPIRGELTQALTGLPTKTIPLTAWDARLTYYDFSHVNENIPIDTAGGVTELTLYQWGALRSDVAGQRQKVEAIDAVARKAAQAP